MQRFFALVGLNVVQFRTSVFYVAASILYGLQASKLATHPVAFYAAVFVIVNATYICLIWELIDRTCGDGVSETLRRVMRFRSITTLCLFGIAAAVALEYPVAGLGIYICCLLVYLKPDPRELGRREQVTVDEILGSHGALAT